MEQNSNYRVLSNVCVSCGVRIPDIDFEIKPAMRETYGLFLVTAGKGIFIIDGIEYPVKRVIRSCFSVFKHKRQDLSEYYV